MLKFNYEEYIQKYGGVMPESKFKKLTFESGKYISKYTQNRADSEMEEVKLCCYAILDILEYYEELSKTNQKIKNKKSETVGNWSVTYSESNSKEIIKEKEKEIEKTIYLYLSEVKDANGLLLLYRGF